MIFIISSAKTLAPITALPASFNHSEQKFDLHYKILSYLQKKTNVELAKILRVSTRIAEVNTERYQDWGLQSSYPALYLYNGDVYKHIDKALNAEQKEFVDKHLYILSGLYGCISALAPIKPYRLEMKNSLPFGKLSNVWSPIVTDYLNQKLAQDKNPYLINLASNEYSAAIDQEILQFPMINIHFRQVKEDQLVNIGMHTKKVRGLMTNFILAEMVNDLAKLEQFSALNYQFNKELSDDNNYYYIQQETA